MKGEERDSNIPQKRNPGDDILLCGYLTIPPMRLTDTLRVAALLQTYGNVVVMFAPLVFTTSNYSFGARVLRYATPYLRPLKQDRRFDMFLANPNA